MYLSFTRRGARVLALGMKRLGRLSTAEIRQLSRDEIESELQFEGFLIVSCPLKPDSKAVIHEIMNSSHKVVMITGDNALTACHVAKQLKMATKCMLILNSETLNWESIDQTKSFPFDTTEDKTLVEQFDLCLSGTDKQTTFYGKYLLSSFAHCKT
jgi:cation-transporting ATPase 13A1